MKIKNEEFENEEKVHHTSVYYVDFQPQIPPPNALVQIQELMLQHFIGEQCITSI